MNWEVFVPSVVTALATFTLAILNYRYVNEIRRERKERETRELQVAFYTPLLESLIEFTMIPDSLNEYMRKTDFVFEELKKDVPYLVYSAPRNLLERIELFSKREKKHRQIFYIALEKMKFLIKETTRKDLDIPINHMNEVYLLIEPTSSLISLPWKHKPKKDFYSFFLEGINPRDWFEDIRKNYYNSVKLVVQTTSNADPYFENHKDFLLPENFIILHDLVQDRIAEDEFLEGFLKEQMDLLADGKDLTTEIKQLLRRS